MKSSLRKAIFQHEVMAEHENLVIVEQTPLLPAFKHSGVVAQSQPWHE